MHRSSAALAAARWIRRYNCGHSTAPDEMRCKDASDAADDIYLMTFRGNTAPFDSNVAVQGPENFGTISMPARSESRISQ
jgi:hypothetical protein